MTNLKITPVVDASVETPKGDGIVTSHKSGWYEVKLADGSLSKFRAKDLVCYAVEVKMSDLKDGADEDSDDNSVKIVADLSTYERTAASSGNRSYDNGDDVAVTLRGLDLDAAYKIVARELKAAGEQGITINGLKERYSHLGPGHQRMCLGNRLRSANARALEA